MVSVSWKLMLLMVLTMSLTTVAQDEEKKLGWFFEAELAGVWTGGNSESRTLGLGTRLRKVMPKSQLRFEAGGTRTESSLTSRTAMGTSDNFEIKEEKNTEKTAELFYARGRYDYNFSKRFFALGGVDWLRNKFAGIDSRFLIGLGFGNTWADNEKIRFNTNYSFTYTFQSDVVENPFIKHDFPGVRLAYDFWIQLTTSTQFTSELTVDWNLDNTDDVRADFTNALPIAISEKLILKPSLQLLWRNDPALTQVELVDSNGMPTGEMVLTPLQEIDSLFSLTLVVKI
jgi:putative salt-induced outer membrane protein YdiY